MPDVRLDVVDAAELAELLQFLSQWPARDRVSLGASLGEFAGHPAYNVGELRQDLDRFTFPLGGDDGESRSATARPGEAMTLASPLRGPKGSPLVRHHARPRPVPVKDLDLAGTGQQPR